MRKRVKKLNIGTREEIVPSPELRGRVDELIHEGRFAEALKIFHKGRAKREADEESRQERNKQ